MSTAVLIEPAAQASPRCKARLAGGFYLLTFIAGISSLFLRGTPAVVAGLATGACYVGVTLLFYSIFKPAGRNISLLAALVSLAGIVNGPLGMLNVLPFRIHSLVFFGCYCLMLGYLIYRSTFLPHILAALIAAAGLGWLTFLAPSFANSLVPYIYVPGVLGEGALTVWLLVVGVDERLWIEQAEASRRSS